MRTPGWRKVFVPETGCHSGRFHRKVALRAPGEIPRDAGDVAVTAIDGEFDWPLLTIQTWLYSVFEKA
jgi:hypothetical protein